MRNGLFLPLTFQRTGRQRYYFKVGLGEWMREDEKGFEQWQTKLSRAMKSGGGS